LLERWYSSLVETVALALLYKACKEDLTKGLRLETIGVRAVHVLHLRLRSARLRSDSGAAHREVVLVASCARPDGRRQ